MIKVGKISGKYDILPVEEKLLAPIGNRKKITLEITSCQTELEARRLKVEKMRIQKKRKKKDNTVRYW